MRLLEGSSVGSEGWVSWGVSTGWEGMGNLPPLAGMVGVARTEMGLVTQSAAASAGTGVAVERWRRVVRARPVNKVGKEGIMKWEGVDDGGR